MPLTFGKLSAIDISTISAITKVGGRTRAKCKKVLEDESEKKGENKFLINFFPFCCKNDALPFFQSHHISLSHSPWQNEQWIDNTDDLYKQWSCQGNGRERLTICTVCSLEIAIFECEEERGVLIDLIMTVARHKLFPQSNLVVLQRFLVFDAQLGFVVLTVSRRCALEMWIELNISILFYVRNRKTLVESAKAVSSVNWIIHLRFVVVFRHNWWPIRLNNTVLVLAIVDAIVDFMIARNKLSVGREERRRLVNVSAVKKWNNFFFICQKLLSLAS